MTRKIVIAAILSALLIAGKFALSFIPNVEVVTLLIAVYVSVFGIGYALTAVNVFCLADMIIYPFNLSVAASYFVYFNLLVIAIYIIGRATKLSHIPLLITAVIMTAGFGFLTAFFDHLITGAPYLPMYLAGLVFYAVHILSVAFSLLFGYLPLKRAALKSLPNSNNMIE